LQNSEVILTFKLNNPEIIFSFGII